MPTIPSGVDCDVGPINNDRYYKKKLCYSCWSPGYQAAVLVMSTYSES